MAKDRLSVAMIGVGAVGDMTLQALAQMESVHVAGVSDRDGTLAEQIGRKMDIPYFSDNRSLLAEGRPDVVFLAIPPMACPELIDACAKRGIHVWKEAPLARNLDEGVAMVKRMEKAGLKLAVGTRWRFCPGYHHAQESLSQLGRVFLARAHYLFNWGPRLSWRGDLASAGGGALLELGYHPVDLLQWMLGFPEEVYSVNAVGHRDPSGPDGEALPVYDTDDTAAAILRYKSGAMATVVTSRASGPISQELNLHGRNGSLSANSELCLVRDPEGNMLDHTRGEPVPLDAFRRQAGAFLEAVRIDAPYYQCSGRENLLNLAVLEAMYLAGRTGQPETPRRLLSNANLDPEDCLTHCKPPADPQPLEDHVPPCDDLE